MPGTVSLGHIAQVLDLVMEVVCRTPARVRRRRACARRRGARAVAHGLAFAATTLAPAAHGLAFAATALAPVAIALAPAADGLGPPQMYRRPPQRRSRSSRAAEHPSQPSSRPPQVGSPLPLRRSPLPQRRSRRSQPRSRGAAPLKPTRAPPAVVPGPMPSTWTVAEPSLPALTHTYSFGPGTATALAVPIDGGIAVVSAPFQPAESVFTDLEAHGKVRAIVAPNAFHNMGLAGWKARYPDAPIFAPAQSIPRLEEEDQAHRHLPRVRGGEAPRQRRRVHRHAPLQDRRAARPLARGRRLGLVRHRPLLQLARGAEGDLRPMCRWTKSARASAATRSRGRS